MAKDAVVRARMETSLKDNVEAILENLGMNVSDAINIFFKQVEIHNGLPFEVKIPNTTTLKTFQETDAGIDLNKAKDVDDLFSQLEED